MALKIEFFSQPWCDVQLLVPRVGYLYQLVDQVKEHFAQYAPTMDGRVWFENKETGQAVKWCHSPKPVAPSQPLIHCCWPGTTLREPCMMWLECGGPGTSRCTFCPFRRISSSRKFAPVPSTVCLFTVTFRITTGSSRPCADARMKTPQRLCTFSV